MIRTGRSLGGEILDALNIPAERVSSVTLTCNHDEVALVHVTFVADVVNGELTQILRKYEVREILHPALGSPA